MKNLVIVESPYKTKTISNFLGKTYKVVASVGHIRDLPKSQLGVDIENGFKPKYIVIHGKNDVIKNLKSEVEKADNIFLATDADREGEAISWHLAEVLDLDKSKTYRVTFNDLTDKTINESIKNPRQIDMNLVDSQQARRILDRLVGYKVSPFLWKKIKSGLSAGRVQSVATRIIVEREKEIENFIPKEYWILEYVLSNHNNEKLTVKYYGENDKKKEIGNREELDRILGIIDKNAFTVRSIKKAVKNKAPAPPYTTSTLQQDAYRKLNFNSSKTMKVAQELYEGIDLGSELGGSHGLITYMRTDSLRVSTEAQNAAEKYIKENYGENYYPSSRRFYKSKNNAQDAHEAIRPSMIDMTPDKVKSKLSNDQFKLYRLIWNRFMASQMASEVFDTVEITVDNSNQVFKATGSTIKFKGYSKVYNDNEDTESEIPEINEKENLKYVSENYTQNFTAPPARYTDGTLVKFLEEKGIGRPSTFATIIQTIIQHGYVERFERTLKPTPLGVVTTEVMMQEFPEIMDYKFTNQMEESLDEIESGMKSSIDVLSDFYSKFEIMLNEAQKKSQAQGRIKVPDIETEYICEKCGSKMVVKTGRFGKFLACSNFPVCKNTKKVDKNNKIVEVVKEEPESTDLICEKCGKPMVIRNGRNGRFYACSDYPKCKNTKSITDNISTPCPKCGGKILVRKSKRNRIFYSCENYPKCDFSSWDKPTDKKCPKCGNILYEKKSGKIVCINKECDYKDEN